MVDCYICGDTILRVPKYVGKKPVCEVHYHLHEIKKEIKKEDEYKKQYMGKVIERPSC